MFKEEVFQIVGAAMEVLNEWGHGLHEKPYENALVVELACGKFRFANNRTTTFSTKDTKSVCLSQI